MGYSLWRPLAIFFIQGYQINDIPNSNRGYSTCLTILPQGSTGSQGQAAHLKWQHEVVEQEKMFCLLISVGDLAPNLFVFPYTVVIIYGLFSSSVLRSHLNPEWDVSNLCINNLESDFTYCCYYWLIVRRMWVPTLFLLGVLLFDLMMQENLLSPELKQNHLSSKNMDTCRAVVRFASKLVPASVVRSLANMPVTTVPPGLTHSLQYWPSGGRGSRNILDQQGLVV